MNENEIWIEVSAVRFTIPRLNAISFKLNQDNVFRKGVNELDQRELEVKFENETVVDAYERYLKIRKELGRENKPIRPQNNKRFVPHFLGHAMRIIALGLGSPCA